MSKVTLSDMSNNRIVMPTNVRLTDMNKPRNVVFYGRVSTEHEEQISALKNQIQWYDDQAKYHPNWCVLKKYIDEGITGTQAKKRPAFMEMIEDAKRRKFDLIVTREVCRFARNIVDTLVITRELKNFGVEVYFVEDNIWTMDGDGELRLSLMATLAQEESRKTSERVRAGQKISRDKGVLYGNGNILGYDRDISAGTYVINEEQAETVRIIYNLYLNGNGIQKIRNQLYILHRKNASGIVKWDCTTISRILHNATYKGYMGYLKSCVNNFLEQKTIRNNDESTYLYKKGNFEPIISEEVWDKCKEIRERKTRTIVNENGSEAKIGRNATDDLWANKLICKCGRHFRKNKWHINKGGITYGYQCYNQLNNGTKKSREVAGLSSNDYCDMGTIADWKLEMMAWHIFKNISVMSPAVIREAYSIYDKSLQNSAVDSHKAEEDIKAKIEKNRHKISTLTEMRMGEEITKEEYQRYKLRTEQEISALEQQLEDLHKSMEVAQPTAKLSFDEFWTIISSVSERITPQISHQLAEKFIKLIKPDSAQEFRWYLDALPHRSDEEFREISSFTLEFADGKHFRDMCGVVIHANQWRDLSVRVYI